MSTLEAEMDDIEEKVQDSEVVEITDCGRVSERTQGVAFMIFFEAASAPSNRLFV